MPGHITLAGMKRLNWNLHNGTTCRCPFMRSTASELSALPSRMDPRQGNRVNAFAPVSWPHAVAFPAGESRGDHPGGRCHDRGLRRQAASLKSVILYLAAIGEGWIVSDSCAPRHADGGWPMIRLKAQVKWDWV
jgi:hypothetical protein